MSVASQIAVKDRASKKLEKIAARYARLEQAARAADAATSKGAAGAAAAYDRTAGSVRRAGGAVNAFGQTQAEAVSGAGTLDSLWGRIKGYAASAGAAFGAAKLFGLSDSITSAVARLDLINDGLQTTQELQDKIMASADRARASYVETAAAVSKLGILAGKAFSGNDEIIAFTELMNKNFVVGGASATEQAAAMYQLTQAMASGRLQGDEYRSIIENAPLLAQAIEEYMRNVQGATGTMKDWASEGLLTADVIKAAMFSSASEVEERFAKMPMTWAQVWTLAGNLAIRALSPLLTGINWLANNLSIIGPLAAGLGTAFLVFQAAAHWTQIAAFATAAYHAVVGFLSIGFGVLTGNAAAASAAVFQFNSTLLASPVTWVVMGIALLIALLYAGVAAYNKFTDSSVSATGIIGGAFAVLGAFILNNSLIPIQRGFASFANFLGSLFNDPVAAVKVLFYDAALTVLGYLQNIAHGMESLINKIPGLEVDLTSGIDSLYDRVSKASQAVKDRSGWVEYVKSWDYIDYGDAAGAGYAMGEAIRDKIGGAFAGSGYDMTGLQDNVASIASSTGKMAEEVNIADEDLKFLRDVAEMRYIQNFVTLSPTVAMNASISERVDVETVVSAIERKLEEEFAASAEGVFL